MSHLGHGSNGREGGQGYASGSDAGSGRGKGGSGSEGSHRSGKGSKGTPGQRSNSCASTSLPDIHGLLLRSPSATRGSSVDSVSNESRVSGRSSCSSGYLARRRATQQPQQAEAGRSAYFDRAAITQGLRRLSVLAESASAAFTTAGGEEDEEEDDMRAQASSSSSHTVPRQPTRINIESFIDEVHLPFQVLLREVPDPEAHGTLAAFPRLQRLQQQSESANSAAGQLPDCPSGTRSTAQRSSEHQESAGRGEVDEVAIASVASSMPTGSPLFTAVVRARLSNHLLSCYEAVTSELEGEEAALWDAYIGLDLELSGMLRLQGDRVGALGRTLEEISGSSNVAEAVICALDERLDENGECDFADLLDVFHMEKRPDQLLQLSRTVRSSIANFLEGTGLRETVPRPVRQQELRVRASRLSTDSLAVAAAAYQRTLVLTMSWRCEQRLHNIMALQETRASLHPEVAALLQVLRGIHSELAPTERVLWELLCEVSERLDDRYAKEEVLDMLAYLQDLDVQQAEDGSCDLQELQLLRQRCRQRSADNLFGQQAYVRFAEVLRWWWDMSEEYRQAAGLIIPSTMLKQSIVRMPEEMFRPQLRQIAAEPSLARTDLRGQIRALAELAALAVRRSIEQFTVRSEAASGATSENGDNTSNYTTASEFHVLASERSSDQERDGVAEFAECDNE
eukprot:TRINITY_DN74889_c0_g1_i1.p1 TRINITY_DN74889_c0_g1~~TRINITY_DN74889_c0_g1_i1.p1  ORF type:complete len:683 (+),score=153.36 TRINITY_DN74889_c0_g1_i1:59-2107(+)